MKTEIKSPISLHHVGVIFVFSFLLISPILLTGIPDNYDVMEHMRFAVTYSDSLGRGEILPLWSEKDNFGFGGAGVRLYPPLTYVVFSFIHQFSGSWHLSLSILLFSGMLVGSFGVYFFTREFYPNGYPLLASFVYAVIPYHLFQIYQLFLLAEFIAAAFTPFVFYFGTKLVKDGGIRNSLLFSTFFSLVVLSHVPSTIILSIGLTIFLALQLRKKNVFRTAIYTFISAILTLGTTCFYWLKVVSEVKWVRHNDVEYYNKGLYTYSAYLFPIFLDPPEFYQIKILWMFDIIIPLLGTVLLLLAAYLISKRKLDRLMASLLLTAGVAIIMTTIVSRPIWDNIEFLQKLQFPWRWLSILMVMISFIVALFVQTIREQPAKIGRAVLYPTIALAFVASLFVITQIIIPMAPLSPANFDHEVNELGTTKGCPCWWPALANNNAFIDTQNIRSEGRIATDIHWNGIEKKFSIEPGAAQSVRLAIFNYPYWKAEINGNSVKITSGDDGTINIPVPAEKADVRLFFDEPVFLTAAKLISGLFWAGLLFGIFITRKETAHRVEI